MRLTGFSLLALAVIGGGPVLAAAPERSLRPEQRPIGREALVFLSPEADTTAPAATTQAPPPSRLAVARSLRPVPRGTPARAAPPPPPPPVTNPGFERWIDGFGARARAAGIQQATLDRAFEGVRFEEDVIRRDQNQAEFNRALWDYLDSAVSDARVRNGRAALSENADILRQIERRYGVEAEVVVAVWGLETAYGAVRGSTDIISAMATLAYEGRRRAFFEAQLIAALRILQAGDVNPRDMTGSWAGAMGHTQFMPTSYLDYAVDITGDGRRDIWSDNPADALASTANYLSEFGWTTGQPWGMEVTLPRGFDYSQTGERTKRSVAHWQRQGVRLAGGGDIPNHGQSSILLPAGAQGVAFIIFDNFHVIERYNPADAYVIGVGHLSDRITGGAPFRAGWPRDDRVLTRDERVELQERLTRAGFNTRGIDGIIGPNTLDAVRRYQASIGVTPDGYASLRVLERLR